MYEESEEIDLFKVKPKRGDYSRDPRIDQRMLVWNRQAQCCFTCKVAIPCKPTNTRVGVRDVPTGELDHRAPRYVARIYPQYRQAVEAIENLQLLCLPCHRAKSATDARLRAELGPRNLRALNGRPGIVGGKPIVDRRTKKPVEWLVVTFGLPHIENNSG